MNLRGKKTLMITGALEIIIGLLSILGIIVVLTQKENIPELTNMAAKEALGGLLLLYAVCEFHIHSFFLIYYIIYNTVNNVSNLFFPFI